MNAKRNLSTVTAFDMLEKGRKLDRFDVLELLIDPSCTVDDSLLGNLIFHSLERYYYRDDETPRGAKAEIRRGFLGALARISDENDEAGKVARRHLDEKVEGNRWVREETFAGLIAAKAPDLEQLAQRMRKDDSDPLMVMLAVAVLAKNGHDRAIKELESRLDIALPHDRSDHTNKSFTYLWASLRALRKVPIEEMVGKLVHIAGGGLGEIRNYPDELVYDAIVALGQVPSDWSMAIEAARILDRRLIWCRQHPWMLSLHLNTLRSLGNLRFKSSTPRFIEELTDDRASVIIEAARALQYTLGTKTTVARVVEAASDDARDYVEGYGNALRWMARNPLVPVKGLSVSVEEVLEEVMVSGPVEHQETARKMLLNIGGLSAFHKLRARTNAIAQYTKELERAEEKIRTLFERSIKEAQEGYKLATYMDLTVFILGILLIAFSAALVLISGGNLDDWTGVTVTGGSGVLGALYGSLLKNPRRQIREAVDSLMRLKIVFLGYLRQLHQADQAYTRGMLEEKPLSVEDVGAFNALIGETLRNAVEQLSSTASSAPQAKTEAEDAQENETVMDNDGLDSDDHPDEPVTDTK